MSDHSPSQTVTADPTEASNHLYGVLLNLAPTDFMYFLLHRFFAHQISAMFERFADRPVAEFSQALLDHIQACERNWAKDHGIDAALFALPHPLAYAS